MRKSSTKQKINHPPTNTLISSTTTDGTSTTMELKFNQSEKAVIITSEYCLMPEVHRLKKPQKINNNNNSKNHKMITMMITAKYPSTSIKTDNQNGFVLNFSLLSKTPKSQESDLSTIMIMKELIDLKKEVQAPHMQVLKFTVLRKP